MKNGVTNQYGFGFRFVQEHNRTVAFVKCDCGETADVSIGGEQAMPQIMKKFEQKGWKLKKNHKPVCLKCQTQKLPKQEGSLTAFNKDTPNPRPLTPIESVKVFKFLEENFDEGQGCYIGNVDDKSTAAMFDLPPASVVRFREEINYKIKGNPEILSLKNEVRASIADLDIAKNQMIADCEAARALLAELGKKIDAALARFK